MGSLKKLLEGGKRRREIVAGLTKQLTADEIADLEAVVNVGRPGVFAEDYEQRLAAAKQRQANGTDARQQLYEVVGSPGMLVLLHSGARKLGRSAAETSAVRLFA